MARSGASGKLSPKVYAFLGISQISLKSALTLEHFACEKIYESVGKDTMKMSFVLIKSRKRGIIPWISSRTRRT